MGGTFFLDFRQIRDYGLLKIQKKKKKKFFIRGNK